MTTTVPCSTDPGTFDTLTAKVLQILLSRHRRHMWIRIVLVYNPISLTSTSKPSQKVFTSKPASPILLLTKQHLIHPLVNVPIVSIPVRRHQPSRRVVMPPPPPHQPLQSPFSWAQARRCILLRGLLFRYRLLYYDEIKLFSLEGISGLLLS